MKIHNNANDWYFRKFYEILENEVTDTNIVNYILIFFFFYNVIHLLVQVRHMILIKVCT